MCTLAYRYKHKVFDLRKLHRHRFPCQMTTFKFKGELEPTRAGNFLEILVRYWSGYWDALGGLKCYLATLAWKCITYKRKSFYTFILLSVLLGGRRSRNFSHKTQPRPRKTFHSGSKANTDVCCGWLHPDSKSTKFPKKFSESVKAKSDCAIAVQSLIIVFLSKFVCCFHFSLRTRKRDRERRENFSCDAFRNVSCFLAAVCLPHHNRWDGLGFEWVWTKVLIQLTSVETSNRDGRVTLRFSQVSSPYNFLVKCLPTV